MALQIEDEAFLSLILDGPHGEDMQINPAGSPPGAAVRVIFTAPFRGQDVETGQYSNTAPQMYIRISDAATITPEVTPIRIQGILYTVHEFEPVEGGTWFQAALNRI